MDYFKRVQQKHKQTGAGGWNCFCCDIQSRKPKQQRKNKKRVRRYARRMAKYELKGQASGNERKPEIIRLAKIDTWLR